MVTSSWVAMTSTRPREPGAAISASGRRRRWPGLELQTQAFETGTDRRPDFGGIFAHAGREHQRIDAAHDGRERADRLAHSMRVDAQGQPGLFVPGVGGGQHLTHISRDLRHAQKA